MTISRRRILQGMVGAAAVGSSAAAWTVKSKGHLLQPGEKLKPGEFVWHLDLRKRRRKHYEDDRVGGPS